MNMNGKPLLWPFIWIYLLYFTLNLSFVCNAAEINISNIEISNEDNLSGDNNNYYYDAYNDIYGMYDEYSNMNEIEDKLNDIEGLNSLGKKFSFKDIYRLLLNGDITVVINKCIDAIGDGLTSEILDDRPLLLRLIVLIIIAAVFNNYSSVLKYSYVGEQGFFITYLMSCAILMRSFFMIYDMSEVAIYHISETMKCMLPAFAMSLIMCSGIASSQMTNSIFVVVLAVMEKVILTVVLPMMRIYFLISLLIQLNGKDRFSKLAELVQN